MMYPWRRLGHSHDRSAASAIQLALRPPAAQNDCSAGNDTSMKECFHVTCVDVDCFTPLAHRPRQAQAGLDNVHGSSEPYPGVFGSVSKLGAVNFYSNARTLVPSLAPKMLGITRQLSPAPSFCHQSAPSHCERPTSGGVNGDDRPVAPWRSLENGNISKEMSGTRTPPIQFCSSRHTVVYFPHRFIPLPPYSLRPAFPLVSPAGTRVEGSTADLGYTSTNMKFFSAAVLSLFAVVVAAQEPLDFGGQCGTFVGTFPCKAGLKCCYVNPDDGKCTAAYRVLHTFQ
ncbi:hypothetical protein AB1N83_007066 [Pleurotus pulmonarius]